MKTNTRNQCWPAAVWRRACAFPKTLTISLAVLVLAVNPARAATLTWNNGAGTYNWTTDANWSGSIWNSTTPDEAIFGATGVGGVSVTEATTAKSVTINDAGYTLADGGGTLQVNGAITNNADSTVSAILVGGLTLQGTGNLTLTAFETYTGATVVNGGTLTIDATSGGLYYSGGGPININSGGTLSMSGTIGYACPAINNIAPGSGSVILNGGRWQHTGPSNGKGTQPKSGRNFTIGALGATLDSGTAGEEFTLGYRYDYDAPGVIGATAGGTLTLSGDGDGDLNYQLRGTGGLIKTGAGTWKLSNVNTYGGNTVVMAGTLALANGADLLPGTGQGPGSITSPSITLSNGATFDVSLATGGFTLGGSQSLLGYGTVTGAANTAPGSKIYAGLDGTYGTNTFSNNLSLASGALCYFDLGTAATGPNDRMEVGGDLALSSPVFHLKAPSALASLDTTRDYVLIEVTGTISGSPSATPVWDVAPVNAANFRVLAVGKNVVLRIVTGTPPSAIGSASPPTVNHFDNVTVSVTVTPGSSPISTVSLNAVAIGGAASIPLVAAGGNVYTNTVVVGAVAAIGTNTVSATVTDTSSLSAVANIPVVVVGANRVWNGAGADDNWSSNPNWLGGKGPGVGDTATFAGATRLTPSMDSSYSLAGLAFDGTADSFVLGNVASTLSLTGTGVVNNSTNLQTLDMPIVLAGSPAFNTAAGDVVLGKNVTGSGSLIKAGNGNLTFSSGPSDYTGATIINGGTLTIGNGVRLYNTGGGPVTINSGGMLSLPGGMDVSWGGCLGYLPPYANNMLINGGILRHTGTSNRQVDAGAGRGFTIGALGATLDSATAGETFSIGFWDGITIASTAGGTLTLTGEGDGVIAFPVPGSGGVTKTGIGTWTLSASNNTYTGSTTVNEGTLVISYPTLPAGATVSINASAVLQLDFAGTNTVQGLILAGVPMPPGVYSASTAPSYLSGSGSLLVPNLAALSATRDFWQATAVTVVFNKPVSAGTATNALYYTINHSATVSAVTLLNVNTVVLTTSPLSTPNSYVLTINSVQDLGGGTIPANTQLAILMPISDTTRAPYRLGGTNNVLVLEAEDYNQNTPGTDHTWNFVATQPDLLPTATDTNVSGTGVMYSAPNSGGAFSYNPGDRPVGNPQLDYKVYFPAPGVYLAWVRGAEGLPVGSSDSVNLGLDGAVAYRINGVFPQAQGYVWGATPTPAGAVLTVPTAGLHVFNLWMREDGFAVDKIILTTDFSYTPTGLGPAESPGPGITITPSGTNLVLTWAGGGLLQSSTNVVGPYTDIIGSSSPWTNAPTSAEKYYRVRQ